MNDHKQLRKHILELLDGASAHIDLESALADFPPERISERPRRFSRQSRRQHKAQRVSAGLACDRRQSYRR